MVSTGLERRGRQAAVFALFFVACVALALLANPAMDASGATGSSAEEPRMGVSDAVVAGATSYEGEAEMVPSESSEAKEASPEGVGDPTEAELEEAREDDEREEALSTPDAAAERVNSRYAYTDLSPEQSEELLRQRFAVQLEQIDADPSRALSDVVLEEVTSPTEALVSIEGEKALIESSVPLRAPDDGELAKLDLELEQTGQGYVPKNSLAELSLPDTAAGQIQVGQVGVSVATEKAAASIPRRFGEEDLYLPEAAEDTSLLLSPITGGVELSALVLSRNSPEQLPLDVTVPPGAVLRAASGGGAEVVDLAQQKTLATISAPHAWDAQGTSLPVALSVKGNSVSLELAHQAMDIAYPAFIDPEIEENWSGFADTSKLNYWSWQWYGVGPEDYIGWRSCIVTCWGNGLYVRSRSNFTYPGGTWGRWWFVPQGSTTYMRRVILGPMNYDAHGCTANEPHPFVGVWNDGGWWSVLSNAYPSGWGNWIDTGGQNLGPGTRTALVGISAASNANINCGHDYRLGGAVLYLNDPEDANVGTPTGQPTKWVKDKESFTLNVPVSDPGLGVKSATIAPKDSPPLSTQTLGCTGHYNSPCPANHTFQFSVSADSFDQGEKEVRASATDAMGKGSNTQSFMMKVDRTPPDVTLAGQLATATDEAEGESNDQTGVDALKLPVYNLEIQATDGSDTSPSTRRSGVKSIEVFLDKKTTPEKIWTQLPCSNSCGMKPTYTLKLNELTALKEHELRVVVKDHADNIPRERIIEFEYVPATGMKEEYVLHYFPLPNGQGKEAEEEDPVRPELVVNVMNGNLAYRQLDVEVPGPAADLEVERYYNSLLPESQDTEWGDGWTLAQTPTFDVEEPKAPGPPTSATLVEESGAVDSRVELPEETGEEVFDEKLQAVVSKEAVGYAITDETGESEGTLAFDEAGVATELRTPGYAEVDYSYEGGDLAEISVDDPAAVDLTVEEAEEWEELQSNPAFVSSFGSYGTGPAQFDYAGDIGRTAGGSFWVADPYNHRILKLDEEGNQLDAITQAGDGKQLMPNGLTVDVAGNVLITDSDRHLVEVFNSNGNFVRRFGGGWGTASGQFRHPQGLTVDPQGDVLVTDMLNGRLQEFSATGTFKRVVGTEGSGPGQIQGPADVAVAADGTIWVADFEESDVEVLKENGTFVRSFGTYGSADGQFASPVAIALGTKGKVWVADMGNGRVQQFNSEGTFVRSFGSKGSGEGQFQFGWPVGIVPDNEGNLWITDGHNDRVQKWAIPGEELAQHHGSFGTYGTGPGQFDYAGDVGQTSSGALWVADPYNHRIQKLDEEGNQLDAITQAGDGKQLMPNGLAVDAQDNVLITDSDRHLVEVFDSNGNFVRRFGGGWGTAQGQFRHPQGLTIDPQGDVLVTDMLNGRLQEFSVTGTFKRVVGTEGSGPGQIQGPADVAVAPDGTIWVADFEESDIEVLKADGTFIRSFGTSGSGAGQFASPVAIALGAKGAVWVADMGNGRVQQFDQQGAVIRSFGSKGSGEGQFQLGWPVGIVANDEGDIWVTDGHNDRVQRWRLGRSRPPAPPALSQDDPAVDVEVSDGQVDVVEGEGAGLHLYAHSSDLLTAHGSAEGTTQYAYDGNGRMTKVTLPNKTYGEIAYEATYGRVKSVTVAIGGQNPQITYFTYEDQPQRRTTVTAPGVPVTTYEFAADGSMIKWWNKKEPPKLDDVGGTLHDIANRETATPIQPGLYNLQVQAFSAHGIASIKVIANNNSVVSEKTCPQIPGPPIECETEKDEWVMETGDFSPGILYIEVVATNSQGESSAERFWVNNPYTPPPDPEAEPPPRFKDIRNFREEFGLDLDIKSDEEAINDRIFNLIGDWHNPLTAAGEVARATMSRWGVPLRAVDAAELEFREAYVAQAAEAVPLWTASNAPSTYAGYYVDHRAGGIIHVGFTQNQSSSVAQLKTAGTLMVPERVQPFPYQPGRSASGLESLRASVSAALASPSAPPQLFSISVDIQGNGVEVRTAEVSPTTTFLNQQLGSTAGINVIFQATAPEEFSGRYKASLPFLAGMELHNVEGVCTAGFGAWSQVGTKPNGDPERQRYVLTAGHCYTGSLENAASVFFRSRFEGEFPGGKEIGRVERQGFIRNPDAFDTDALAIALKSPDLVPGWIYECCGGRAAMRPRRPIFPSIGEIICQSSRKLDRVSCGPVTNTRLETQLENEKGQLSGKHWLIAANVGGSPGDSGAPVWVRNSGRAVGIVAGGDPAVGLLITPLLRVPAAPVGQVAGILTDPRLSPDKRSLHLQIGR
jgi:tripartite motif-containing protein 71